MCCRAEHQASSINLCNAQAGVTTLRSTSASVPWVLWGERSILHAGSVRLVCGVWAQSLLSDALSSQLCSLCSHQPNLGECMHKCLQCFGLQTTAVIMFLEKRIQPHSLNHAFPPSFLPASRELLRVTHVAPKGKCQHSPWLLQEC